MEPPVRIKEIRRRKGGATGPKTNPKQGRRNLGNSVLLQRNDATTLRARLGRVIAKRVIGTASSTAPKITTRIAGSRNPGDQRVASRRR